MGKELTITHSLFADDTLLFGLASIKEEKYIKFVLDLYKKLSGQKISNAKSKVFLFHTRANVGKIICKILDFE